MKNLGKIKILAFAMLLAFGVINAKAAPMCVDEKCVAKCAKTGDLECEASCFDEKCDDDFKNERDAMANSGTISNCDEDCVMANVVEYLHNQVKKLIDESYVMTDTLLREFKDFSGKKYGFVLIKAIGDNTGGYNEEYRKNSHCAAIIKYLPNKADVNAVCSYGINEEARIDFKGAYFTIVFENNDFRNRNVYKDYTTYKFIDDDFYLYQYSREYFKAGDKKGQFVLDKTDIFYRQPRDDKSKSVLIPISVANQQFMENLVKQCYKSGKCKE